MMRHVVVQQSSSIAAATLLWLGTAQPSIAQARPVGIPAPAPSMPAQSTGMVPGGTTVGVPNITVVLRNVTLDSALTAIGAESGISIAYGESVLPLNRRVTVVADDIPMLDALRMALRGVNATVNVSPTGKVEIVRAAHGTAQQGSGSVVGMVTDARSNEAIGGVTVIVNDAPKGVNPVITRGRDGRFVIPTLPAGSYVLVARRLGYLSQRRPVTVVAGDTARVEFHLGAVPSQLQGVVTTGAGDRTKLEVGNAISTIDAEKIVRTTPIRNVADLLKGRAAGVDVLTTGGTAGAGSKIRIRGQSSLMASEDPVVVVDGVRFDAAFTKSRLASGLNTFQKAPTENAAAFYVPAASRLNDIDPESIESIEVLKGPAASALYGSDAANGVIVIKTKRGRAGPTRWSLSGQMGRTKMHAVFPEPYYGWGNQYGSIPLSLSCNLMKVAARECEQDSVTHYNPLNHAGTSPFKTGRSGALNGQVSGGTDRMQYFVNTSYTDETGMLGFPSSLRTLTLQKLNGNPIPEWSERPNVLNALALASTMSSQFSNADIAVTANGRRQYHRDVRQGSQSFVGQASRAIGYLDDLYEGWSLSEAGSPIEQLMMKTDEQLTRGNGSLTGNWRPFSMFSMHGTGGVDYSNNDAQFLYATDNLVSPTSTSQRTRALTSIMLKTVDGNATLDLTLLPVLTLRSTAGTQYLSAVTSQLTSQAQQLQPGSTTVNSAGYLFSTELTGEQATTGWYLQESATLNQRLFLTVGVRTDVSSSFGQKNRTAAYPKWNASWLVSEEPFFPRIPLLNSLRFRLGYGHAGAEPPFDARYRTYQIVPGYYNGANGSLISLNSIGNNTLLPERSVETEGGFDVGIADDRIVFALTIADKSTRNSLVSRPLPPSFGENAVQIQNIGRISNHNFEFESTIRPLVSSAINWTTTLGFSQSSNRVISLGSSLATNAPAYLSDAQPRYVPGYPVDGLWTRPVTSYGDANHDGIIDRSEVKLADSVAYAGHLAPSHRLGMQNNVSVLSGRVSLGANFTYEGGGVQYNSLLASQCSSNQCRGAVDPTATLREQAMAAAAYNSSWPFLERISTFRFEEMSLTVEAPSAFARAMRSSRASVSLMGRNLKLWTHYRGADPEVNSAVSGGDNVADGGAIPQPRTWTFRVNLGY